MIDNSSENVSDNQIVKEDYTKKCENCGKICKEEAKFCDKCGKKFSESKQVKKHKSLIKKIFNIIIYCLGIVLLLFILLYFILDKVIGVEKQSNYNTINRNETLNNQQLEVNNKVELTAEEKELKEGELKSKLSNLKLIHDDFSDTNNYYANTVPGNNEYWYIDTRSFVLPYIYNSQNKYTLNVISNYYGDDWLFISDVTVKIDGEFYNPYEITTPKFEREVSYGNVSESKVEEIANLENILVGSNYYELLKKVANSQETIIRFSGKKGNEDITISNSDKQAIREVLEAWDLIVQLYGK